MADRTAFYFAATAAGMRQEDVNRAIELAEKLDNDLLLRPVEGLWQPVVFFSPTRLALRPNGTLIGTGESMYLASGHVFIAEWNCPLKYNFKAAPLVPLWSQEEGYNIELTEVVYL